MKPLETLVGCIAIAVTAITLGLGTIAMVGASYYGRSVKENQEPIEYVVESDKRIFESDDIKYVLKFINGLDPQLILFEDKIGCLDVTYWEGMVSAEYGTHNGMTILSETDGYILLDTQGASGVRESNYRDQHLDYIIDIFPPAVRKIPALTPEAVEDYGEFNATYNAFRSYIREQLLNPEE
ncbi:hypothetical protein J4210_05050 [Candidatus Woesearchaeota archaeon]|nr:hypothetical protein [Candidatus Woesearchaeota archaeon]